MQPRSEYFACETIETYIENVHPGYSYDYLAINGRLL